VNANANANGSYPEGVRLRAADQDLRDEDSRADQFAPQGGLVIVGQTTTDGHYPTVPNAVYAMVPVDATGAEVEGAPGTFATAPGRFYAVNCGGTRPALGTRVPCFLTEDGWIFFG
jgi:hypothetical protein